MDKMSLRPLVFEALRRTPQTHVHAIENEVRQKAADYERGDALLVQEVVWELLLQGILAPGKNSLNLHLPFIHVTEYGQKCLDTGAEAAHDPEGYTARLQAETRSLVSEGVLESARDAIAAFDRGLFRTSVVLLSRAAAQLLDEVRHALDLPARASRSEISEDPRALVDAAQRSLSRDPNPPSLEDIERGVAELEALVRLAHADAGTPCLPSADRESALGRLLLFPTQCRFAYTLIARGRGPLYPAPEA